MNLPPIASRAQFTELKNDRRYVSGSGVACGVTNSAARYEISSDELSSLVISWVLTGDGILNEDNKAYRLTDGCVCIRRPDRSYSFTITDKPSVRLYFDLPECFYETLKLLIPELAHIPPVRAVRFRTELYEQFLSLYDELSKTEPTELYRLFPRLTGYILSITGINDDRAASPLTLARSLLSDASCSLTLEQVAERCKMNYNTFRKRFSEAYGISPHSYRSSCRMEAACQALAAGESIASISQRLGFADIYSFTHRFTAELGISPAKYRDRNHGG